MDKFFRICVTTCLLLTSSMICADVICSEIPQKNGAFFGLGASYNSIKFKENYSATGTGTVFDDTDTAVAVGNAGGPAAPYSEIATTLAPVVHAGYFNQIKCTNRFWGLKCRYQYLDATSINKLTDTPQAGILVPQIDPPLDFTGNVITKSAQTKLTHNIDLFPFVGISIEEFKFYFGIGPSIFKTETNIY